MHVLIVDDEPRIRSSLMALLKDDGHAVLSCGSGEQALEMAAKKTFDVLMLDVLLPGMDGLETLAQLKKNDPGIQVIMMSGQADIAMAVKATRLGARNFFEKPLNPDHVLLELKHVQERLVLESRVRSLESMIDREETLIGGSVQMNRLRDAIARAAPSEGRVLIFGENGTGKELVARAVHRQSERNEEPFVSLNCAALPKDLVESELFGYEKGAFTGAVRRKPGRFETADGGTLFLDEVGDMGLETQAKLLRVLEESEAVRVGGETPYRFDVRIIAATNKNLDREIESGRFREDLYYRLNVIPLMIPPLRDRRDDIPLLADHFLNQICEKTGKGMKKWGMGAKEALLAYHWPGNVRELRNTIERLVIMSDKVTIDAGEVREVLPAVSQDRTAIEDAAGSGDLSLRERLQRYERRVLEEGYARTKGNVSMLARMLKIDRANLHRKLKTYGIK